MRIAAILITALATLAPASDAPAVEALSAPGPVASPVETTSAPDLAIPTVEAPLAFTTGDAPAHLRRAGATRAVPEALLPDDAVLRAIVDSTSEARITATVARLEAFGTRYVVTDSCLASARWLVGRFEELGVYEVRVDTFRTWTWQDSVEAWNVLAVRRGTTRPDEHVILGGHYDSVSFESLSDPLAPAPGADDNASGVAAVLEAARVLARYQTERTLVFACWSAEEEGLWGSRDYVARALAGSLDVVLYMNLDAVGYNAAGEPDGIVSGDSLSYAVAALAADVADDHLGLDYVPLLQPLGASDQNSFVEAGYPALDTSSNPLYSPYHHSANDRLEYVDTAIVREVAAVNAAVLASVALIDGEDPNLPPETTFVPAGVALCDTVTVAPTFRWRGDDFDGSVAAYALEVLELERSAVIRDEVLGPDETEVTLSLEPGAYALSVAAIDDDGATDPTPARHAFEASNALAPVVTVTFLRDTLRFRGARGRLVSPMTVFEGERLPLSVDLDASSYCGLADRAAVFVESEGVPALSETPFEITIRPGLGDTAVFVIAPEPDGGESVAWIPVEPAPAPFDRGTLHIDDWLGGGVPEDSHDAFYEAALVDADEWDPYEHIEEGSPTLPPPETLGRYGSVVWTLSESGGLMRANHATESWRLAEAYVRAGGNLIVEGPSAAATLAGSHPFGLPELAPPGSFLRKRAGVLSVATTGNSTDPAGPLGYGYAFLGAAPSSSGLPPLAVDTLGSWAEGHALHGGLPWCEVYVADEETERLYLFNAFRNDAFDEKPCAVMRRATDGSGSVVILGFPLYYIQPAAARVALEELVRALEHWQTPSTLSYFSPEARPDSVVLRWYIDPVAGPSRCRLDRTLGGAAYVTIADSLTPSPTGRYRVVDTPPEGSTALYRLAVTERSGVVSMHGPWEVFVPWDVTANELSLARPSPSTGPVTLEYGVAADHRWVTLAVYDVAGRLLRVLREGPHDAGRYSAVWDGRSNGGERTASGVYFARLRVGGEVLTRKVVLLR